MTLLLLALVRTTFDAHSAVLFLPDQSGNYTVALSSTDNEPSVQEVTIAPGKGLSGGFYGISNPSS